MGGRVTRAMLLVWLTCLALLWGGAMAGWGQLALASRSGSADLPADWCVTPADTLKGGRLAGGGSGGVTATSDPSDASDTSTQDSKTLLHAKVHCDLCVVAADLPRPPALRVPAHLPAESATWRGASDAPLLGRLSWQQPQSRGPPAQP
ncbi:DUF2946 family protein [Sphaerotilus mobilis]|uniref:DUF2946 family protein n=2 Tax=Sphaerotilus mobilis TaxID=47994 RepID=A0A4Q7LT31_9BURK|nr:DUF2946 family protein [Sphaerotilus mobilis]